MLRHRDTQRARSPHATPAQVNCQRTCTCSLAFAEQVPRASEELAVPRIKFVQPMQDFKFQVGEHGKPMLDTEGLPKRIRDFDFNITHTDGLIGLAVAAGAKVGIDCERIDRTLRSQAERIAGKMFSVEEQQELLRTSSRMYLDSCLPLNQVFGEVSGLFSSA